jgi:hypothetical protein
MFRGSQQFTRCENLENITKNKADCVFIWIFMLIRKERETLFMEMPWIQHNNKSKLSFSLEFWH